MAFDALAIANYFLDKAKAEGKSLTPLAVQKLVYFAHGWHLALRDQPLVNQRVQAWEYGPVIADIYREFKEFGKSPITRKATRWDFDVLGSSPVDLDSLKNVEVEFDPSKADSKAILDRVWDEYKKFSGVQLSNLTHLDNSPWAQTRNNNPTGARDCVIEDSLIKDWFKAQAQQNAAKRG